MAEITTLQKATIVVKDGDGNVIPPATVTAAFSSANVFAEVIDDGGTRKLTGKQPGSVVLTVQLGPLSATLAVDVVPAPLTVELVDPEPNF